MMFGALILSVSHIAIAMAKDNYDGMSVVIVETMCAYDDSGVDTVLDVVVMDAVRPMNIPDVIL